MLRERNGIDVISEFMRYLARHPQTDAQGLPALAELSRELGVSVASLREQLEVARALGLVDVRPRLGIRRLPYTFRPAVRQSLAYALTLDESQFQKYSDLRNHIESTYWDEAVRKLTEQDKRELRALITRARQKLEGTPIQVPHEEHRSLHLLIYRRLENPFVTGLLEAYWDAYEGVGLNVFAGSYEYLQEVWKYHELMVQSICNGDYQAGREALEKHIDLLYHRPA
ncbi:MAG: FadR/GntR family transcriptional regulator [Bacteroidota bacterium]